MIRSCHENMQTRHGINNSCWFPFCRKILNLYWKFWHGWWVKWSCLYENIADFPFLTTKALVIKEESTKVNDSKLKPYMIIFYKRSLISRASSVTWWRCTYICMVSWCTHYLNFVVLCYFLSVDYYSCLNSSVFAWVSIVIHVCFGNLASLCYPIKSKTNQSWLARARFPALCDNYM